jgi:N-carbamoylputrescine amidase
LVPVVAANRVGIETGRQHTLTFYGTSFIAGPTGEVVVEADRTSETVITAEFDLDAVASLRHGWGVFRDRRPELYEPIVRLDGSD